METNSHEFLDKQDLEFTDIDTKDNIKNNFFHLGTNFKNLSVWLSELKQFLLSLYDMIKPSEMTKNVISDLSQNKINLLIPISIGYDSPIEYLDVLTQQTYQITKKLIDSNDYYEIINITQQNWNSNNLLVYVKNNISGIKLNPEIYTFDDKITLVFVGKNNQNLNVILL